VIPTVTLLPAFATKTEWKKDTNLKGMVFDPTYRLIPMWLTASWWSMPGWKPESVNPVPTFQLSSLKYWH